MNIAAQDGKRKRVGVMGWPVQHSRSPLIHNYWIRRYGIHNTNYERIAVEPHRITQTLSGFAEAGFIGANVTLPHKETVFQALTHHDAAARRLGAVNTIVMTGHGLEGRNTDGYGFIRNLQTCVPDWHPGQAPLVILGAGGAARAVVAALSDRGASDIRLVNRTRARAQALARDLDIGLNIFDWCHMGDALSGAGLLVNTTSLGMNGEPAPDPGGLQAGAVVADIVYTPLVTPLLERAMEQGYRVVDGLGMLLHQAVPAFEAWFGVRPAVDEALRRHVLADLQPGKN